MLDIKTRCQKIQQFKKLTKTSLHLTNEMLVLQGVIRRAEERRASELASLLTMKHNRQCYEENIKVEHAVNTAIIKPVGSKCNLTCYYCYYSRKAHFSLMDENLLRKIISEMLMISPKYARFIWHGGEPLLAGVNFYKEVVRLQKELKNDRQEIVNIIQTNGTLLDSEFVDFFKKSKFGIGISLDGQKGVHNLHRKFPSGEGSYSHVMRSISLLKRKGVKYGILSVLSQKHKDTPNERIKFFIQNGIFSISIDPCCDEMIYVSPNVYADFMKDSFDEWLYSGEQKFEVRQFDAIIRGLIGHNPSLCLMSGTCGLSFICIESNGDVWPCDQPFNENYKYGNILEFSLENMLSAGKYKKFLKLNVNAQKTCSSCRWFFLCHGGCSFKRIFKSKEVESKDYYCKGYQEIFAYITNSVDQMLKNI